MASSKITALTALTTILTDDVLPVVDVHDTTQASSGTTKQITVANLQAGLLKAASNLSDVANAGTARTNLGAAALQAASVSYKPANPAATASGSLVCMGIGSTCVYTPSGTGKARVTVNGAWLTATTTVQGVISARFGTGTAPVNGAADTGTRWGTGSADQNIRAAGTGGGLPFSFTERLVLTPGTAYWFDLVTSTSAGADLATITNLVMTIEELPS